ncbi:MAG: glycoside hydrolase [Gemmatimonadota bacterium]|nr:glycoside hydrolase [Gemmatimonadota bacterium]
MSVRFAATLLLIAWSIHGWDPDLSVAAAQVLPPSITVGKNVLVSRGEAFPHVEPHLAANPRDPNRLVAAAMTFPEPGRGSRVRVYVSRDGGKRWTSQVLDTVSPAPQDDPQVAFAPDGTAYLSYLPGRIWRSHDGGLTWQGPASLPTEGGSLDYPVVAVDSGGAVYIAASQVNRGGATGRFIFSVSVFRSTDQAVSFEGPVRIQPNNFNNQSGDILIRPDGAVLVTLHENGVGSESLTSPRLWTQWSSDKGQTFSVPHLVTEGFASRGPALAMDRSGGETKGRIYAVWAGMVGDGDNRLSFSDNGGATWSKPVRVTTGAKDRYPTRMQIAVNPRGIVGLSWKEQRPEVGTDCFQLYFTASLDHGRTFLEPVPVAPVASCGSAPGNAIPFNAGDRTVGRRWRSGGDYDGLVAMPDGNFRALWTDSRTGSFQIWTAPITVRP